MGLPSKRRTKTSKKERASHFALKPKALAKCTQCGKPVMPHHACGICGNYKGRTAIKIKIKSQAAKAKKKK
ncbi:MAG: 50S ribosomal protein L32 [Patescibacteria group bacterium]|jgi:large subunit ribosomal protein L32